MSKSLSRKAATIRQPKQNHSAPLKVFTLIPSLAAIGRSPSPSRCILRARATSTTKARLPSTLPALRARCSPAKVLSEILILSCLASVAAILITTSRNCPQESKYGS